MSLTGAERQARYRERLRAQATVTEPEAVTVTSPVPSPEPVRLPVTPLGTAVTHELSVGPEGEVTEPDRQDAAITEHVGDQSVTPAGDVPVEPVTAAPPSPGDVTVAFTAAELRRLDQWRRFQWDAPDRSAAVQLLVRQALGMAET